MRRLEHEMNRKIKRNGKAGRTLAGLLALTLGLLLWAQPVLVGCASNSLGSQGNAVGGGGEAQDAGGEQDAVVDEIIGENTEDLGNTSTASKVTMKSSSVRVRREASTNAEVVGSLSSGDSMDVVGETNGSDGMLWYQIKGEKDGKAIDGFVRSDLVEVTETVQPEVPEPAPEPETPAEQPSDTGGGSFNEYDVAYTDDGTGVSDWFLNDNINGNSYRIAELLEARQINESNIEKMDEQSGRMRIIIIVLAVVIGILVVTLTFMIFKLKNAYDSDYDGYEDEEDEDGEDEEEDYRRGRGRESLRGRRRASSGRSRYEEDEDEEEDYDGRYEEDEDEEEDYDGRYEDDEEDDAPRRGRRSQPDRSQRSSRQPGGRDSRPRNFLEEDEDDDLDFEFLDLK